MGLRLLPFRQYDEQDVVNMFALNSSVALDNITQDGEGSNGVFVKITDGNITNDTITYGSDSYLGKTDYPHVNGTMYPTVDLTISGARDGDIPLGITLNQTAKEDENGEKLLYNKTKMEEAQAVLPGQAVPVATKGIFTISNSGFGGGLAVNHFTIGEGLVIGTTVGQISGASITNTGGNHSTVQATDSFQGKVFGKVLATGIRTSQGGITDQFAGDFVVVQI